MFMNSKNLERFLKSGLLFGVFTVPFIVFIVFNDTFFPFITGKSFAFRVIIELLFGGWIVLAYLNEEYRPKKSFIFTAIALLVVVVGVANIFGVNLEKSIWSNYERMDGYVTILHLFAYFIVLISFLKDQKHWYWLFNVMIVASCVMSLIGIGELINPNSNVTRLATTLGNPIYLAVYMLFHIFITLYCFFRNEIKSWGFLQVFYIVALILQTINLYFTATRGTIIGLVGGLILTALLIALFETKRTTLRKMAIGTVGFIVISLGLFISFKEASFIKNSPVLNRFATISIDSDTAWSRIKIWEIAEQGFKERPILGWGQGNFPDVFNKYYNPELHRVEPWYDRAHNVFFDWLIAAGIVGLVSYLLIFVATLYQIWKKKEEDFTIVGKSILTGLLAAYFVHNVFVFDNLISYLLFFTVIAYIHFRSTNNNILKGSNKINHFFQTVEKKIGSNKEDMVIPALIFLITIATVYMVNYAPYMQNKVLIEALKENNYAKTILSNDWGNLSEGFKKEILTKLTSKEEEEIFGRAILVKEYNDLSFIKSLSLSPQKKIILAEIFAKDSLSLFKKSFSSYDSFGNTETRERLLFEAINVNGLQVDQEIKNAFRDFAIEETKKQIEENPGDAKYPLFATSLYKSFGMSAEAKVAIELAYKISPQKQAVLFELGSTHMAVGEYKEALEVFKNAYEISPGYEKAVNRYGLAALYAGDEELAKEVLIPFYGTHLILDPAYINFFAGQKRFDVVADLLAQMIEKEPSNPQHYFQMVGAYVELDQRDKALETLEGIGVTFPELKENADFYIGEINNGNI